MASLSPNIGLLLPTNSDVVDVTNHISNNFTILDNLFGQLKINTNTGAITVGTGGYADTGVLAQFTQSIAGYNQIILQNMSSSAIASSDIIVSNNLGTASTYYGDFGINSSNFSGSGSLALANATYLYAQNGDLVLGTNTSNAIHFVVNNGATDALTINSAGTVTTVSNQQIRFYDDGTDSYIQGGYTRGTGLTRIRGAGGQDAITVDSTGRVGINQTAPTQNLEIHGTSTCTAIVSVNNGGYIYLQNNGSNSIISSYPGDLQLASGTGTGDVYTNAWADYSGSSTFIGWTSAPSGNIFTKKIGKTVFVQFNLTGTSGTTAASFTVPYNASSTPSNQFFTCLVQDNSGSTITSYGVITNSGKSVSFYATAAGGSWTSSGTKSLYGEFVYQSA